MAEPLPLASAEQRDHIANLGAGRPAPLRVVEGPSDLEIIRRAMCLADGFDCSCNGRGDCLAASLHDETAQAVLAALKGAGRL